MIFTRTGGRAFLHFILRLLPGGMLASPQAGFKSPPSAAERQR